MARKETIYVVSKKTGIIERASRTLLAAYEFSAAPPSGSVFVCTSEFQNLKKGDPISNITATL